VTVLHQDIGDTRSFKTSVTLVANHSICSARPDALAQRQMRALVDVHSRRKDSLRGQPHVGCRPTDPRRHRRGVGGTDHGNRALTANIGMGNGTQLTAHAMRGWRRISLTRPRSSKPACLAERLLRVLGRRLQSPTRPVS
jgi:hypothetical protein